MVSATATKQRSAGSEQLLQESSSATRRVGDRAPSSSLSDPQAWTFESSTTKAEGPIPNAVGGPFVIGLGDLTEPDRTPFPLVAPTWFSDLMQQSVSVVAGWPLLPPQERRLQSALELERADISFDEVAAGLLGRFYDLGHASTTELEEWLQSPEQWIAFSRLQRCRYIEDLGSMFTLSLDGRNFVEDLLAEGTSE